MKLFLPIFLFAVINIEAKALPQIFGLVSENGGLLGVLVNTASDVTSSLNPGAVLSGIELSTSDKGLIGTLDDGVGSALNTITTPIEESYLQTIFNKFISDALAFFTNLLDPILKSFAAIKNYF